MDKPEDSRSEISTATVRICPACCTVNPSGPSAGCPHVQLVRFNGLRAPLEALLAEVAAARRSYNELNTKLRAAVLEAVREGGAEVETARKPRAAEGDTAQEDQGRAGRLRLAHSETSVSSAERRPAAPKRRRTGAPPVDPRQLTLLAFSPPKGDA